MYSLDCLKAKNEEKLKKSFILVQSKKYFARFERKKNTLSLRLFESSTLISNFKK